MRSRPVNSRGRTTVPVTHHSSVVPIDGQPCGLTLDSVTFFLWWGPDAFGNDCVATTNGLAGSWSTAELARAAAQLHGWPGAPESESEQPSVDDLDPALAWLRGRRASVDPGAALNLWNIADDIARSTGQTWNDRGRVRDRCYDKLLAANLPWLVGRESLTPRWTSLELDAMRAVLGQAIHVLRVGIGPVTGAR